MKSNEAKKGQAAVVIGASMGGLLAARALADFYEQVTVLERDTLPDTAQNRKGAGQGWHTHGLLARGREILERSFPGLTETLMRQGAPSGDLSDTLLWCHHGGYHATSKSGLAGLAVSRPALEAEVRRRVRALPNVTIVDRCDVLGLVADDAHQRVLGVRSLVREAGQREEVRRADLVVDASGRGSRSPQWLEGLGYERPAEEQVKVDISYATRYFRRRPDQLQGKTGVVLTSDPPATRGGVVLAQEDDRWVVTLAGYLGDRPPADERGFLEYARSLPKPEIYDLIRSAEPLTDVLTYKYPASLRRRYEQLRRFPEGYLVYGDALCSFNPIFGQGMTVCASEMVALQGCLETGTANLARRFFAQASRLIDVPWNIVVGSDLRYPGVEGKRTAMVRFINGYLGRLHVAAWHDPQLAIAFLKVLNLLAPPDSLMRPAIALRVLHGNLRRAGQRATRQEHRDTATPEQLPA